MPFVARLINVIISFLMTLIIMIMYVPTDQGNKNFTWIGKKGSWPFGLGWTSVACWFMAILLEIHYKIKVNKMKQDVRENVREHVKNEFTNDVSDMTEESI